MIKALSSEERSFFIENTIGDLNSLKSQQVAKILKEELCRKPYAGLFIVYMIDSFEHLSTEEIECWDTCCSSEAIYRAELLLLSKSNQSRFSHFILSQTINRADDKLRVEAVKFVERLRELGSENVYEAIIEEGSEEAVMNGEEEVKFLKKDIK